jgi:hypothetical protein
VTLSSVEYYIIYPKKVMQKPVLALHKLDLKEITQQLIFFEQPNPGFEATGALLLHTHIGRNIHATQRIGLELDCQRH